MRDFFKENCLFMVDFVNNVRSFVRYAIFCELCNWMRFEVNCVKSHHHVISEGLVVILYVPRATTYRIISRLMFVFACLMNTSYMLMFYKEIMSLMYLFHTSVFFVL